MFVKSIKLICDDCIDAEFNSGTDYLVENDIELAETDLIEEALAKGWQLRGDDVICPTCRKERESGNFIDGN